MARQMQWCHPASQSNRRSSPARVRALGPGTLSAAAGRCAGAGAARQGPDAARDELTARLDLDDREHLGRGAPECRSPPLGQRQSARATITPAPQAAGATSHIHSASRPAGVAPAWRARHAASPADPASRLFVPQGRAPADKVRCAAARSRRRPRAGGGADAPVSASAASQTARPTFGIVRAVVGSAAPTNDSLPSPRGRTPRCDNARPGRRAARAASLRAAWSARGRWPAGAVAEKIGPCRQGEPREPRGALEEHQGRCKAGTSHRSPGAGAALGVAAESRQREKTSGGRPERISAASTADGPGVHG